MADMPAILTAGDTLIFTKSTPDYLPEDSWVLHYAIQNNGNLYTVTGTDNGDSTHLITITAAVSSSYSPGEYLWQSYVTKTTSRYTIAKGVVTIEPDLSLLTNYDVRTHAKRVLDAIEAVIEGRATKDQESYAIEGRQLSRTPIPDLLVLRDRYKTEYESEVRASNIANGLGGGNRVLVRF